MESGFVEIAATSREGNVEYNTVELEKLRVAIFQVVTKYLMRPDVRLSGTLLNDEIVARISGYLWAEPLQHVEIKYPATWQDAWKEEHLTSFVGLPLAWVVWRYNPWYEFPLRYVRWWLARRKWVLAPWALKRWPIQYKTHVVDVKAVFPELRPEEPYVIHYTEKHGL